MTKINCFHSAAWLISQDYILDSIEWEKGKGTTYHFTTDKKMIDDELADFEENSILNKYVCGIIELRKRLKNKKNKTKTETKEEGEV